MNRSNALPRLSAVVIVVALSACNGIPVQHFEGATPVFDPIAYFDRPTHSWGVIEARDGAAVGRSL